jgi:hypothetical protein
VLAATGCQYDRMIHNLANLQQAFDLQGEALKSKFALFDKFISKQMAWQRVISHQNDKFKEIANRALAIPNSILLTFRDLSVRSERADKVLAAGWLPHSTLPWGHIDQWIDDNLDLSICIEQYYLQSWQKVSRRLRYLVARHAIDDEAKRVFHEMLVAHRMKLYRLPPRAAFPELERVARLEMSQGMRSLASQKLVMERMDDLGLTEIDDDGIHAFAIYKVIRDDVYQHVTNDVSLLKAEKSGVPNRHASIHGLINYSSIKNSINSIMLTEIMFRIISAIKLLESETTVPVSTKLDH